MFHVSIILQLLVAIQYFRFFSMLCFMLKPKLPILQFPFIVSLNNCHGEVLGIFKLYSFKCNDFALVTYYIYISNSNWILSHASEIEILSVLDLSAKVRNYDYLVVLLYKDITLIWVECSQFLFFVFERNTFKNGDYLIMHLNNTLLQQFNVNILSF